MGPLGNFIGAAWFFMLFLAAITSSLSMYQPSVALLKESLGWSHQKATAGIAALGTVGAIMTLWFTQGGAFWSTIDFWVGTFLIFVMAGVQIIYFSWVFGIDRGWKEIHAGRTACWVSRLWPCRASRASASAWLRPCSGCVPSCPATWRAS
jgi:SNF family Na+-dependent transporter